MDNIDSSEVTPHANNNSNSIKILATRKHSHKKQATYSVSMNRLQFVQSHHWASSHAANTIWGRAPGVFITAAQVRVGLSLKIYCASLHKDRAGWCSISNQRQILVCYHQRRKQVPVYSTLLHRHLVVHKNVTTEKITLTIPGIRYHLPAPPLIMLKSV